MSSVSKRSKDVSSSEKPFAEDKERLLSEPSAATSRKVVVWSEIWAKVPFRLDKRVVLKDVYGAAFPGEVLAIMGGSGAGKTTLLNILTQNLQANIEKTGLVLVNGEDVDAMAMRQMSAFVQQVDVFWGSLTVREQLVFSAALRMGRQYTTQDRLQRVDELLTEMNLNDCRDTMIGIPGRTKGISVGEKKRLAFACEVLPDPSILFCDEPTSGLDAFMAGQVVDALKRLAATGKTVITVIHQPSPEVFDMFDRVCFLAFGRVAYHGPTNRLGEFLDSIGDPELAIPYDHDPADHMISILALNVETQGQDYDRIKRIAATFKKHEIGEKLAQLISGDVTGSVRKLEEEGNRDIGNKPRYQADFLVQFWTLLKRASLTCVRDPLLVKVKLAQVLLTSLVISLVNWRVDVRADTVQNIEGVLFNTARDMNFLFLFPSIGVITAELPIFLREHRARIYSVDSYYWAKTAAEVPQYTILAIVYGCIVYWMTSLFAGAAQFLKFLLICVLQAYVAISIATAGACVFGSEGAAITFIPILVLPMLIFGGFYINYADIPVYMQWWCHLSWFRYGFQALQNNQWTAQGTIPGCLSIETNSGGNCTTQTGLDVLRNRGMSVSALNYWVNAAILLAMTLVSRFVGLIALRLRS